MAHHPVSVVPKYRLRYQSTDLELAGGDFVIGRSSSCSLSLDDGLVSRKHALIHTTPERVTLEDLGSRNGVLLNGEKIKGLVQLKHGDRITVGSQEMTLVEAGKKALRAPRDTSMLTRCYKCNELLNPEDSFCKACGAPVVSANATLPGATLEVKLNEIAPEDETRQASGFTLLTGIADKALALGRYSEAERILGTHLERMLEKALTGKKISVEQARKGTTYALKLARGLSSPKWVDWVFQILAALKVVPGSDTVDELHAVVRDISHRDPRALRSYLQEVKASRTDLGPAERFVVSRLESLERVISA
jgi:pSer/pThr/pTyr-binding forkhead associated (FHA) protein